MKGRIQNKTTTIWHPINGHVQRLNTNGEPLDGCFTDEV